MILPVNTTSRRPCDTWWRWSVTSVFMEGMASAGYTDTLGQAWVCHRLARLAGENRQG
jgi:hypothetical protein